MNVRGWVWLLLLPVALVAAAALCLLRERRLVGLPRAAMDRWRQTPLLGKILVCLLFAQFSHEGMTKLLRNSPTQPPPPPVTVVQPDAGDLDAGFEATNLCFTAIERGTNSTALLFAWSPDTRPPLDRVGLFAALELPGPWTRLFDVDISSCASNALVEVMDAEMPTNSPPTAFFRLGDPAPPDADGDGLSDVEEAGEITVRNEFEWHDTSTFPTTYAPQPEGGLGSYFGASLIANLSGSPVIEGISLTQAFAFENGFVSLQAPGDWYGAVFPSVPRPLCYRPYYSGSIVVAPYWGTGYVQYGNTNSYMRAGTLADGTTVVEFHDVKRDQMSLDGMTYQVIIPGGTGDVVRVSYLSSDFTLDGTGAVAGVQNARRPLPGGLYYSLEWDFTEWGPIQPGTTVEYRFGLGTDPDSADSDNDGLGDWTELYETGTDPWNSDTDNDGLSDGDELALGTNPHASDTDGDRLPDAWEVTNGLDPLSDADDDGAIGDPDEDNLTNAQERQLGTDPQDPDTDNDGLDDDVEIALGTDPLNADTDGDGLLDGYEVNVLGSSPFLHDTDGDGLDDEEEDGLGTNPSSEDTDGDGMPDRWEHQYGFDPTVHNSQTARTDDDGDADYDQDGLDNLQEYALRTNPLLADTDGDTISDYAEFIAGTDPCYADTDGDGLDDLQEQTLTTNPLQPDTDGDGMDDGWEHQHGFDPKTHNDDTTRTDDDATADPDGDGLTNAEEYEWRTNPLGSDTDGDGVADGVEIAQNSDPADATDGGASGSRIPLRLYFGDDSGSHSEKYRLTLEPTSGPNGETAPRTISWLNARYGAGEWKKTMLKPGWRYEVRMRWVACKNPHDGTYYPNYDYTLKMDDTTKPPCVVLDDPHGIFKTNYYGSAYYGQSHFPVLDKTATISVYKFTVEEIKFNHEMVSCATDAVNIRQNANLPFDMSHGEWWLGGESLKNDPVCYIGGIRPVVKAKFRVSPELNSARLSASTLDSDSPLGGLGAKNVIFENGVSDWMEFQMDAAIDRTVRKFDHRWEWKVSRMNGTAVTEFVCATTGPHMVYVIWDQPVANAWRMAAGSTKNPWTNALDFACGLANRKSDAHSVLSSITYNLFHNMGFKYNVNQSGKSRYYSKSIFNLSGYIGKQDEFVNCEDQAYAVAALANLLGIEAKVVEVRPFGYLNPVELIGQGLCNNPGFIDENDRLRPLDDTSRLRFRTHMFATYESRVYDACIGPVTGQWLALYLLQTIDYSTSEEQYPSILSLDEGIIPLKRIDLHDVYLLE